MGAIGYRLPPFCAVTNPDVPQGECPIYLQALSQLTRGNNFELWVYISGWDNIAAKNIYGCFNDTAKILGASDLAIVCDMATPTTHLSTVNSNIT